MATIIKPRTAICQFGRDRRRLQAHSGYMIRPHLLDHSVKGAFLAVLPKLQLMESAAIQDYL